MFFTENIKSIKLYKYKLTQQQENNSVNGIITTYGIVLESEHDVFVNSVSSDENIVKEIISILNKYQVHPEHLENIIEDYFS